MIVGDSASNARRRHAPGAARVGRAAMRPAAYFFRFTNKQDADCDLAQRAQPAPSYNRFRARSLGVQSVSTSCGSFHSDECVPVGPNPPFVATGFINLVTAPADSKKGMPGPAFSAARIDDPANYKWNRFHFEAFCRNSLSRKSQQSRNPCAARATIREIVCLRPKAGTLTPRYAYP
ncbi:hypothetical protein [Burkholderia stagnalis]|uniref:hypothetical protein n=1 Tax=Burkholderia stagnalis TaxID=1503054 RepID=UPI000F58E395|nr:hypothetical protein [Burkholderia stagnalis]